MILLHWTPLSHICSGESLERRIGKDSSSAWFVANGEASPEPDHDESAGGPNFPIAGQPP